MQKPQLLFSALLLLATACGKSRGEEATPPKAEEIVHPPASGSSLISSEYRSGPSDPVESMYNELVKTDQELKSLEKQLNDLLSAERDSLAAWESYLSSIDNYYTYAFHRADTGIAPSLVYAPRIEDPDLRAHLRSVLDASKARHTARMGDHDALVASLQKERLLIEDRHEALKVMLTLAVIEAYQLENMPSLDGLKAVNKQQKESKAALEAMLKKAGF